MTIAQYTNRKYNCVLVSVKNYEKNPPTLTENHK